MSEQEISISELKQVRLDKLEELRELAIDPFGSRFERDSSAQQIQDNFDAMDGHRVKIAGRIMSKRRHGKAGFANLADLSGDIQLYFRKDDVGETNY